MQFTVESDIDRPTDEVFDRAADARHEPEWNTQVSRSDLTLSRNFMRYSEGG